MFRIDDATAASTLPTPEAAGTEGFFTEGNPTAGTPATKVRGSWLNMIQEELSAILAAAGITRSKTTYNQVNAALKLLYSPVVGTVRNVAMVVAAASATATLSADEVVLETALGGQTYRLASFNKTINLATTGVGGMDTGTAPTSGFVALYAIYNPTTQTASLLATNAATLQSNVYTGANMPAGYSASALVSVWPTNASKQLVIGMQVDRRVFLQNTSALATSTAAPTFIALNIGAVVPLNAKTVSGVLAANLSSSAAGTGLSISVATFAVSNVGLGVQTASISGNASTLTSISSVFTDLSVNANANIAYSFATSGGSGQTGFISIGNYTF